MINAAGRMESVQVAVVEELVLDVLKLVLLGP